MPSLAVKAGVVVCVGLAALLVRRWLRRRKHMCECVNDMTGMFAIVTGANSGIGAAIATELASRGCFVVMACRDVEKALKMKEKHQYAAQLSVLQLDLASPQSIASFLLQLQRHSQLRPVDVLVNNAAVFNSPLRFTPEGVEIHFAVNHVGHFLLTTRLLELGLLAPRARVVCVASALAAHVNHVNFSDYLVPFSERLGRLPASRLYANAKLANCLFVRELDRRHRDACIAMCVQTDGMAATNLFRHPLSRVTAPLRPLLRLLAFLLFRSPYEAAQNAIHCCVAQEAFLRSGALYSKCRPVQWFDSATQSHVGDALWDDTELLLKRQLS